MNRILVVDDEPAVRDLTGRMLRAEGFDVTMADGRNAVDLVEAAEKDFDLLLTDINMPGISGPELAHRLRSGAPDLRVLYTSGDVTGAPGGDTHCIAKPFTRASLVSATRQALENAS